MKQRRHGLEPTVVYRTIWKREIWVLSANMAVVFGLFLLNDWLFPGVRIMWFVTAAAGFLVTAGIAWGSADWCMREAVVMRKPKRRDRQWWGKR